MYFEKSAIINIEELINSKYKIYAHMKDNSYELLQEHTALCIEYFYKITEKKLLDKAFYQIEKVVNLDETNKQLFREMIINTIVLHDIGKTNAYFQKTKLTNNLGIKEIEKTKYSDHSLLSAIVYIHLFNKKIDHYDNRELMYCFMMINSYAISRHHSDLTSFDDFKSKFDDYSDSADGCRLLEEIQILYSKTLNIQLDITVEDINGIFDIISNYKKSIDKNIDICLYIYQRLILSVLYACDYYATTKYMTGFVIDDFGIVDDIDKFYDIYKQSILYNSIREYEKLCYMKNSDFLNINDINILRNEMFLDAENTLLDNLDKTIFYLEAPTGSGKSNVAFNLSLKLLEQDKTKNKVFYVYPFNTLVEQNIKTLEKIFVGRNDLLESIAIINSITPVKMDKSQIDVDDISLEYYQKALLNRQFLNYPIVLTTHVTLFNFLFGTTKENIFPLFQLSNSIIILDEIQSYKNSIWGEIITFLNDYAKILNIKIIIMSATLPNLDYLNLSSSNSVKLIKNREKYFNNPLFKNRVSLDYYLLDSSNIKEDLYNHVKLSSELGRKILIEFISKDSAYEFYKLLKCDNEILSDIELMTGDDNIAERERILHKILVNNNANGIILVSTQVIEAGVDIDIDIGYKDISLFDSEEQFLGRINRSCKKENCIVYFFNMDNAAKIY